jgi:ATP-binding cassette subfamily B (MDR/TAP) protein 1
MIAAGALLPLMDIVFGRFVTVFNNFVTGSVTPEDYRSQVNKYTYAILTTKETCILLVIADR